LELGTAFVTIEADQTKLTAGLNKAQANVNKSADAMAKKLAGIGKGMTIAGGVITAAVAGTFKTFTDYETKLVDMAKVTGESFKSIEEKISGIDPILGASTELMSGYYQVISAGVKDPVEALGTLTTAAETAKAAHVEQSEVVKGITKMMAGYEGAISSATEAADLLFSIEKEGQTSVAELIPVIGGLAKVSYDVGVEQKEMAASLAVISKTAGSTAEAATQYQAVISGLMKPTADMTEAFTKIGESIRGTGEGYKSAQEMIKDLGFVDAMKELSKYSEESDISIAKLFGRKEAMIGFSALGAEGFKTLNESIISVGEGAGGAKKAFEDWSETGQASIDEIKNTFLNFSKDIGQKLAPMIKEIIGKVTDIIEKISEWVEANPELTEKIVLWGAAIGGIMVVLGPLLMALPGLVTLISALLSPIGLVVIAAAALYLAFTNWDKLVEIVGNIANAIVTKISEWAGAINTWWDNIVANTDNKWILVADKIMDAVKGAIKWVAETIGKWIKDIFKWWNNIEKDADSIWGKIAKVIIDSAKAWIKFFADTLPGWILDIIKFFTNFKTKATKVWDDIKKNINKIAKALMDFVEKSFDRLDDVIKIVKDWAKKTVKFIKDLKVMAVREVKALIDGIFKKFEDLINLPGKMLEWGKNAITGFTDGIKNKMSDVTNAVKSVGDKIKGFLGFESPPKEGPLSTSDKWMPNMMAMFGAGITNNTSAVLTPVDKLATLFEDRMARLRKNVDIETGGMMDDIETAVKDAIPKIIIPTETLAGEFLSVWDNLKTDFKSNIVDPIVGYLTDNLANAIYNLLSGTDDIEFTWESFWEGLKDILIKAVAAMIAKLVVLAAFSWLFQLLGLPVAWLGVNKGGEVEAKNKGGEIEGFAKGGSSTDTVPAMLTPGEYVISKPMVDFIKRTGAVTSDLVGAIRSGARTPVAAFAGGGGVGASDNRKTYSSTIQIQPGAIVINTPKFGEGDAQNMFRLIERQARYRGLKFATN